MQQVEAASQNYGQSRQPEYGYRRREKRTPLGPMETMPNSDCSNYHRNKYNDRIEGCAVNDFLQQLHFLSVLGSDPMGKAYVLKLSNSSQ